MIDIILKQSDLIREVFPDIPVLPALGNHDYHPKNQLPGVQNKIYNSVAERWRFWMNGDEIAEQTFRKGQVFRIYKQRSENSLRILFIINRHFGE